MRIRDMNKSGGLGEMAQRIKPKAKSYKTNCFKK
jgi:hypothetical protein